MYLKNIAGYNIRALYHGEYVQILCNNNIYRMPDDFEVEKYKGVFEIIQPMNVRTQPVIYIKVDGTVSEHVTGFMKKRKKIDPLYNPPKIKIHDLMNLDEIITTSKKNTNRKSVSSMRNNKERIVRK